MNAYPGAVKRAYGDSFGLVGPRAMMKVFDEGSGWVRRAKALARRALIGVPREIPFDEAVLTLPMDQSGSHFSTTPLRVPERRHAVSCVERIYAAMPALADHCQSLCGQGSGNGDHLYLLSNFTASSLASKEQELTLYLDVIDATAPPGSTVFLKPHPRSSHDVLRAVIRHVGGQRRVAVLDDSDFGRIPIELWVGLVRHCTVVAMFSTSATNLKYLYGKDVCMPLDARRIRQYFAPSKVGYISGGEKMIRESIANLSTWDGRSVLWVPSE
jgi:hypothetical protein